MNPKKILHAIFFDIDDTICATSEFTKEARYNALRAMIAAGLQMPIEDLFAELIEVISEFSSNYAQHFDKLILRLPPTAYTGINPAILIAAAVVAYHNTKYLLLKPYPDVLPFLESIAPVQIVKGIISDGLAIKQAEKILRLKIYPYLTPKAIFISEQVGISKINPKIYTRVCQTLHLTPQHTMFIGDHPQRDIDSANHIGLISVRIRRNGKYQELQGQSQATYEINNLDELRIILQENYQLTPFQVPAQGSHYFL